MKKFILILSLVAVFGITGFANASISNYSRTPSSSTIDYEDLVDFYFTFNDVGINSIYAVACANEGCTSAVNLTEGGMGCIVTSSPFDLENFVFGDNYTIYGLKIYLSLSTDCSGGPDVEYYIEDNFEVTGYVAPPDCFDMENEEDCIELEYCIWYGSSCEYTPYCEEYEDEEDCTTCCELPPFCSWVESSCVLTPFEEDEMLTAINTGIGSIIDRIYNFFETNSVALFLVIGGIIALFFGIRVVKRLISK